MKVLSNCALVKLREYSQSYGSPESLNVPYIKESEKEIWLLNECGEKIRTLRKGTKLLISYNGKEITDRQFKNRIKKAIQKINAERAAYLAAQQLKELQMAEIATGQGIKWRDFLQNNPDSRAKYIDKFKEMPSSKWRNYLRMKAAKHINEGNFNGLEISAPHLKDILLNIHF